MYIPNLDLVMTKLIANNDKIVIQTVDLNRAETLDDHGIH